MTRSAFLSPPGRMMASLRRVCAPDAHLLADACDAPQGPGAYLLAMHLDAPLSLAISTLAAVTLAPGWYLYAGSACGPGGIRARVARHLRQEKPRRWHVDHLSAAAAQCFAIAIEDGDECALAKALGEDGSFLFPVKNFGSSDCRRCFSHLAKWSDA